METQIELMNKEQACMIAFGMKSGRQGITNQDVAVKTSDFFILYSLFIILNI